MLLWWCTTTKLWPLYRHLWMKPKNSKFAELFFSHCCYSLNLLVMNGSVTLLYEPLRVKPSSHYQHYTATKQHDSFQWRAGDFRRHWTLETRCRRIQQHEFRERQSVTVWHLGHNWGRVQNYLVDIGESKSKHTYLMPKSKPDCNGVWWLWVISEISIN